MPSEGDGSAPVEGIRVDFGGATAIAGDGGHGARGGHNGSYNQFYKAGGDLNINPVPAAKGKDLLYHHASPASLPDSSERIVLPRCMKETRAELRKELDNWEKSPLNAATMKWVLAGAGEGKTALLLTFADLCRRQKRSVGAFFASNRITDCSDGNRIIPTLAVQLMQSLPSTGYYIDMALRKNPLLLSKCREAQMNALIVEPIRQIAWKTRLFATFTLGYVTYPTLVVIDGLDEVTGKDVQADIIKIIGNTMKDIRLPLRFLVASRPEPHIVDAIDKLQSQFPKDRVSIMDLRKDTLVHRDIRQYFKVKFERIRAKDTYLPQDWPGEDVIDQLVDKASGQFIYATTIIPYIMFEYCSPEDRLAVVRGLLEKPPGDKPYQNLDELYFLIVRNANRLADMLRIIALIIVINRLIANANAPAGTFGQLCSPQKLGNILGLVQGDVRRCLLDMHSVVNVKDDHCDIQIYHKSFTDFLLDPSRSNEFAVNLDDSYDCLFSHLICISQYKNIIILVLGQCLVSEGMNSDVDILGTPANTSSPDRIETILGLEHGGIPRLLEDIRLLVEVGNAEQDIQINNPSFRTFLLDRSRSQELFCDLDEARLTLKFAAPIRKVFGAQVFSTIFPGPQMPWNKDSSLQLQDVYAQVYSYLTVAWRDRDTTLRILGQVIIAHPSNFSSPKWIAAVLDLEYDRVMQIVAELHLFLKVDDGDKDIRIRHPSFLEFLLDRTRSQDLFVDLDKARLALQDSPAIIRRIFTSEVFAFLPSHKDSLSNLIGVALAQYKSARLTSLLPQTLPNIIFGEYESLVRSAPWNRHPTTAELKQVCANLRESGVLGFGELVIDTKLQMFWDTFTWVIFKSPSSAPPRLLIRLYAGSSLLQEFFSALSNRKVSLPVHRSNPRIHVLLSGPADGDTSILFVLAPTWFHNESYMQFSFKDTLKKGEWSDLIGPSVDGFEKDREMQAWKVLADAWCNCVL